MPDVIEIRELSAVREGREVEELQLAVWGRTEREVVARDILTALQFQGALLAGAFAEGRMIGFAFGFPTRDARVQHSHMLAVLPEGRGTRAALDLKAFQRTWCLERGITRVEWTFDPLRGLNANFNLRKLGAVVTRYLPDFYGEMSGINAGVASDRVLAVWDLEDPRVVAALEGHAPRHGDHVPLLVNPDAPHAFDDAVTASSIGVKVPDDFATLIGTERELALRWRQHGREVLGHYLGLGYVVTGFSRSTGNAYVLTR